MRFLHISDLHIGKRLNDISMLEDQELVLNQIIDVACEKNVQAILIAGDIYQKASPSAEAMALFDAFLQKVTQAGIKVFMISGNHDSETRISYFSSLIRGAGVYASEQFNGKLQQFSLEDEYGTITIHLMPFLKPINVKVFYPDAEIRTYEDAVKCVLEHSDISSDSRNILIAHQFITGAETCDSEVNAVGGLDNISESLFDDFDYAAFGHIHKPQRISRDTMRYSGSPLKYSFSEVNHKKSICLVDMKKKGDVSIELIPFKVIHDMRIVEGMLDDLIKMEYSEDYLQVIVHDEIVPPDAKMSLFTIFPNMLNFKIQNSRTSETFEILAKDKIEDKTIKQLFCDFYRLQNNDQMPPDTHIDLLDEILLKMEGDIT